VTGPTGTLCQINTEPHPSATFVATGTTPKVQRLTRIDYFKSALERRYAATFFSATLSATLVSMTFLIRRRVRSTKASVSARQLSSSTPTP
jgi:hypothetical protein